MKEDEIGTINKTAQKKDWRKHLGRFGNFLMMGGWIVILLAIAGIVIAVSTCSAPK